MIMGDILIDMIGTQDYTWEQGDDLIIALVYKVNDVAQDLTTGYSVRMDIAPLAGTTVGQPVFAFNSNDIDSPLDTAGLADNEVTFPPETPGAIHIRVPRSLTLPGGAVEAALTTTNTFSYDIFLRMEGPNTQKKILQGKILVNRSVTLWA